MCKSSIKKKEKVEMTPENKIKKFMTEYHVIVPNEEYNLFEAASLHEFRHSEILYRLLSYEVSGRLPVLESFLRRLSIDTNIWDFSCKSIHISREEHIDGRPVDVLVVCKSNGKNAALIIENKCCYARDGDGQLHDYIESVKNKYSVTEDRLTCLYLRRIDSLENPGMASVVDDSHASLVTVSSYREQIVPWLKDDVLRNLRYGAGVMVSSLIAYIDILESWSGTRTRTIEECSRIVTKFKSIFMCQDDSAAYKTCKEFLSNLEKNQDVGSEETISVLRTVKQILWESNPMLDSYDLAEELKWMLKNNPYPYGRTIMHYRLECGEMFDYSSIGRWYNVVIAERDVIAPNGSPIRVRIHMNCGNLNLVGEAESKSIVYGGICQARDLPKYNDVMNDLKSNGYEQYGQPENNAGFFFAAGAKLLSTFRCNGSGHDVIWNVARNFALSAKLYSEVLVKHGYKPVPR